MMDKEAKKGIDAAMLAVMGAVGAVGKDRKNATQGFAYRGIEDIYNAVHAAMAEHGVYMLPEVLSHERQERVTKSGGNSTYTFLTVRYKFVAADGSYQECTVCGEGMDSGDKSSNKALAACHKYAITQTFLLPYAEMTDGDKDTPESSEPMRGTAHKPEVGRRVDTRPASGKKSAATWVEDYIKALQGVESLAGLHDLASRNADALIKLDKAAPELRDRIDLAAAERRHEIERLDQLSELSVNPFEEEANEQRK